MLDLCNMQQLQALLARHDFHFSKAKGQNFLVAPWVPVQIAECAGVSGECGVLEVGPGVGPLTQQLCLRAGKVTAIEIDRRLQPILAETLGGFHNLTILWQDVMQTDLAALTAEAFSGLRPMACANLPYYITSPVLTKLLEARCFDSVTVMVQKEVAQRICAPAGAPDYSSFSIFCQYYAHPSILFDVPASCFLPRPKVNSAVIQLKTRSVPPCAVADEALFFRVVRASFAQRRKTLLNGLSAGFPQLGKSSITEILTYCGIDPSIRGERLDIPAFAAIANRIAEVSHV